MLQSLMPHECGDMHAMPLHTKHMHLFVLRQASLRLRTRTRGPLIQPQSLVPHSPDRDELAS